MSSFFAGVGLGFSLIVAIGAQNVFVLRQGIRREHVLLTATICAVSDAVLIVAGVSGIGLVLHAVPWLFDAVRWVGAAFLLGYGVLAGRRAWLGEGEVLSPADGADGGAGVRLGTAGTATARRAVPVAMTALALTWLNPSVYLDTVFLLGTVANAHGDGRWLFALGAMTASVIWFFGVAVGARLLAGWLATTRAWRIFDASIAVLMVELAVGLVFAR
ncbi:MAG: LysE/ArgO family amino acid transporter [Micropruina sp.]|uniref:LysE/ArgO family amino acid transporter n=1 Tax=Micropruina sp. TaxID=2737536 RepID=UPI0039E46F79